MKTPENASLEQICDARRADRLEDISRLAPSKLKLFQRVYSGQASPRQVIKAGCLDCMGYETAEITRCSSPTCPYYEYRPYQTRGKV
jgi:hypothetical protein